MAAGRNTEVRLCDGSGGERGQVGLQQRLSLSLWSHSLFPLFMSAFRCLRATAVPLTDERQTPRSSPELPQTVSERAPPRDHHPASDLEAELMFLWVLSLQQHQAALSVQRSTEKRWSPGESTDALGRANGVSWTFTLELRQ